MSRLTPESRVKNKIADYLTSHDYAHGGSWLYQRRDSVGPTYIKGSADAYVVYRGVHIEIEYKEPNGVRSSDQYRWERICKIIGCKYILTSSFDDFMTQFDNLIKVIDGVQTSNP